MADLITLPEASAWGEKTKLAPALVTLDSELLGQVQSEVLAHISVVGDTSGWTSSANTPQMVKTILAKLYIAWIIDRQYSEDTDLSAYAALLRSGAMALLTAIETSAIDIPGVTDIGDSGAGDGLPGHYPTDASVDRYGRPYGPYFTMDQVF
jgi:hypothetical protein